MVTGHPPADISHWAIIFQVAGVDLVVGDDLHCSPNVRMVVGNAMVELDQFQAQALAHVLLNHKRTLDAMRD